MTAVKLIAAQCALLLLFSGPALADTPGDSIEAQQVARPEPVALHAELKQPEAPEAKENQDGPEGAEAYVEEEGQEEPVRIADPFLVWNTAMFHFNDKLYFWLVKPITQVYVHTAPEPFRILASNFFDNLREPRRFVNLALQLRFKEAGNSLFRFLFNSFAGIGGLGDMARDALGVKKVDADFGQTLGRYGLGHGFYLVWPVFGPSSPRDTVGLAADRFMYPLSYISANELSFGESMGVLGFEIVNRTSFKLGDYESFKESAVDPYVSIRDAYLQHRKKEIDESRR